MLPFVLPIFLWHAFWITYVFGKYDFYQDPDPQNRCTLQQRKKIEDDVSVAQWMARVGRYALLNLESPETLPNHRLVAPEVYKSLFVDSTKQMVYDYFRTIAGINSNEYLVTFYCDDKHFQKIDTTITVNNQPQRVFGWTDNTFRGPNNKPRSVTTDPERGFDATKPSVRRRICQENPGPLAFTLTPRPSDTDLAGQAHIVLCWRYFDQDHLAGESDNRDISTIIRDGLSSADEHNHLENIWPPGYWMFHELIHAVSFFLHPAANAMDYEYGFFACANLRAEDDSDKPPENNADSYAQLALAIVLQVQKLGDGRSAGGRPTWWIFGIVDVNTLDPPPNTWQMAPSD